MHGWHRRFCGHYPRQLLWRPWPRLPACRQGVCTEKIPVSCP
jgi:hypothetical protein